MAFGFSPKYAVEFPVEDFTNAQFLTIAIEAANKLNWKISQFTESGFIAYTAFSMRSYHEEVKFSIVNGFAYLKSECTGNQMFDWGKNKKNIEKFLEQFDELKATLTAEELSAKELERQVSVQTAETYILSQPPSESKDGITGIGAVFIPSKKYFIAPIIIDLNILVFLLMILSGVNILLPDTESLLRWGANLRPLTLDGQWWRLFTNFFLHIGILHLLFNMYALLYIGLLLEPRLGRYKFLAAYLLTGMVASMVSLIWHSNTISAGASGAIFGLYGVFLAMLTTNLIEKSARKALLTSIGIFVGYNLLNGMKGGIDNAAHIGGLLSGLIIGYAYFPGLKNLDNKKLNQGVVISLTVMFALLVFFTYLNFPKDMSKYYQKMKSFSFFENKALDVYRLPKGTSREELKEAIQGIGLESWKKDIQYIKEADKLEIPAELHSRNQLLLEYCDLRIKTYELLYKSIDEDTDRYNNAIQEYNGQVKTLLEGLSGKKN